MSSESERRGNHGAHEDHEARSLNRINPSRSSSPSFEKICGHDLESAEGVCIRHTRESGYPGEFAQTKSDSRVRGNDKWKENRAKERSPEREVMNHFVVKYLCSLRV
jgi:hypothetical protein